MNHKALLKALRDDLAATRRSHDLITAQIAAEEAAYWSTGAVSWIDRGKETAIKSAASSLICRNEETMKAWFDSVN
jgi:hypothetical protein